MSLTILGSGSGGNAALIQSGKFNLLVDCGLKIAELGRRMSIPPEKLDAVILSHEHGDHCDGITGLVKHCRQRGKLIPIWVSSLQVRDHVARRLKTEQVVWSYFEAGLPFTMGDIRVEPYTARHDCHEGSIAFKFTLPDEVKIGFAVDLGFIPPVLPRKFIDCQVIVIESNHDVEMLMNSPRPLQVIDRTLGNNGHLSNAQCAEFLRMMNGATQKVVLAHLSTSNNTKQLAIDTARRALQLAGSHAEIMVADQRQPIKVL